MATHKGRNGYEIEVEPSKITHGFIAHIIHPNSDPMLSTSVYSTYAAALSAGLVLIEEMIIKRRLQGDEAEIIATQQKRIAELEAENANHRKQWDNAIGLFDAIENKLGHEKYSALLVSIIDDDKGEVK